MCGNNILDETAQILYSRVPTPMSRYDCPFFPFLEYHDPAPGAEPMSDNWTVICCQVCKAFLTQQWDSFERANFPINKRLYWLKRPTGCEIRQPVSQIELEEILNEQSKRNQHSKGTDNNRRDGRPMGQSTSKQSGS